MRTTRVAESPTASADSTLGLTGRCNASASSSGTISPATGACRDAAAYSASSAGSALAEATIGSVDMRMDAAGLLGFLRATVRKRSSAAGASAASGAHSRGRGRSAAAAKTAPVSTKVRTGISTPASSVCAKPCSAGAWIAAGAISASVIAAAGISAGGISAGIRSNSLPARGSTTISSASSRGRSAQSGPRTSKTFLYVPVARTPGAS